MSVEERKIQWHCPFGPVIMESVISEQAYQILVNRANQLRSGTHPNSDINTETNDYRDRLAGCLSEEYSYEGALTQEEMNIIEDELTTLAAAYTFPTATYKDGAGSADTFCFTFEGAGDDSTVDDMTLKGCVGTGFTIAEDIGSEGGELTVTIKWVTAYAPVYSNESVSSGTPDTGVPRNIRNLHETNTKINDGSTDHNLVIKSWELSVSRTIERIHYQNNTDADYKPFGYAMVGGFEVTGSMNVIKNDDTYDILAKHYGGTSAVTIQNDTAGDLTLSLPLVVLNESSIDSGGSVLMGALAFTVVGANDGSGNLISITTS